MNITVFEGVATLRVEMPVFIGTTGSGTPGATNFPIFGVPLNNFIFSPEKGDTGTLVFDCAEEAERKPTSPTLFQFWWDKEKLIVREGLSFERLKWGYSRSPISGFSCTVSAIKQRIYFTGDGSGYAHYEAKSRKVGLLDLIRFLENKIDENQLKKLVTK